MSTAGSNAISNPTTSFNAGAIDLFSTDISTSLSCDVHIMAGDPFGDSNDGSIEFFTRGINRMRIDEAGLFIVNGAAAKPEGGDWSNISDKRLKKNVKPNNKGLKEILQINPVSYQYNKMSKSYDLEKTYIGIIAQEIEKVLPSTVVIMNDSLNTGLTDKRIFNSSELLYTAINAIKEQQEIIELLLQKNEFLEHRIKKIKLKMTRKILLLLIVTIACNKLILSQTSGNELVKIHSFTNLAEINNISVPLPGSFAYRTDNGSM
jgi:hypothetical protein